MNIVSLRSASMSDGKAAFNKIEFCFLFVGESSRFGALVWGNMDLLIFVIVCVIVTVVCLLLGEENLSDLHVLIPI